LGVSMGVSPSGPTSRHIQWRSASSGCRFPPPPPHSPLQRRACRSRHSDRIATFRSRLPPTPHLGSER
jgi:hypothetical protein